MVWEPISPDTHTNPMSQAQTQPMMKILVQFCLLSFWKSWRVLERNGFFRWFLFIFWQLFALYSNAETDLLLYMAKKLPKNRQNPSKKPILYRTRLDENRKPMIPKNGKIPQCAMTELNYRCQRLFFSIAKKIPTWWKVSIEVSLPILLCMSAVYTYMLTGSFIFTTDEKKIKIV